MKQSSVWWQYFLPHHFLSQLAGRLAFCKNTFFKNWVIKTFCKYYSVKLEETEIEQIDQFKHFNDFFTRKLKAQARPQNTEANTLVAPVDGTVSALGRLVNKQLLQAKGRYYSLESLLGSSSLSKTFANSHYLTAYLAPGDYHRIHMPWGGRLRSMHYVPGKLFSVNSASVKSINNLFARNERVICVFDSKEGPFAIIAIGAMIVGSIVMSWHGMVNSPRKLPFQSNYANQLISLAKGEEMGYFNIGSTIIFLMPNDLIHWSPSLAEGSKIKLKEKIAIFSEPG